MVDALDNEDLSTERDTVLLTLPVAVAELETVPEDFFLALKACDHYQIRSNSHSVIPRK